MNVMLSTVNLILLFFVQPCHALAVPENMLKRVLVTGANSGIGLALTKQLGKS